MSKHRRASSAVSLALVLLGALLTVPTVHAIPVPVQSGVPTGADFILKSAANDPLAVRFAATVDGTVDLSLLSGNPVQPGQSVAGGFRLLDLSFNVDFTPAAGANDLRARVGIRWSGLRARARALGIRVGSLRVLRLDRSAASAGSRWSPAVDQLRAGPTASRFLRETAPDLVLGHQGLTQNASLVWAVTDRSSGLFAIAGLPSNVPETASLALASGGFITLLMLGLRRERPGVRD